MKLDLLITSETKKKGSGTENLEDVIHCWSGVKKEEHAKAGVAILIKKKLANNIQDWQPVNERIGRLRIKIHGRDIVILAVYGPTEDSRIPEKDEFMDTLKEEIEKINTSQEIIIAGDINGRTGKRRNDDTVGPFGEDTLNDNGERIIELCETMNLKITNGFYQHKEIHKFTWVQPTRGLQSIIDYIIVRKNTSITIKDVRVKRGAECGSDHRLLLGRMGFPWNFNKTKNMKKDTPEKPNNTISQEVKFNLHLLQDESIRQLYQKRLDQKLNEFRFTSLEETYQHVKECIKEAALEALGEKTSNKGKYNWDFSEATKEVIKEKKQRYSKWLSTKTEDDYKAYREKDREVKRLTTKEKNEQWQTTCSDIEQHLGGAKSSESWNVIKSLKTNRKEKHYIPYIDEKTWTQYYKELLTENREEFKETLHTTQNMAGDRTITLTLTEIRQAVKSLKNKKAAGPGGIAPELIKYGSEKLFRMTQTMFQTAIDGEEIPMEWKQAYITSIYKKGDRKTCENYRGISVIAMIGRLYGRVLKNIMEEQIKGKIGEDQAGFTAGRSTIDHIYTIQQLIEKKKAKNRAVHLAFIDLKKAYDTVPRQQLWKAMTNTNIHPQIINAVKNLYEGNKVAVKIGTNLSDTFETSKGLLQGCSTSPTLFKIFMEYTLIRWKQKCEGMGIPIRNHNLYILTFADDQVILAQDEEDLGYMIRKLKEEYTKAGLEINFSKTEYLTTEESLEDLIVDDEVQILGANKFKYLGFTITKTATTEDEIKSRLGQARTCIKQLHPIIWNTHITKNTKHKIYNTMVRSIMTYGAEIWVVNKKIKGNINAVEMEYWRRCCGLTRMDRVSNEEIRRRMGVDKTIITYIEEKRLQWYGHVRRAGDERWIKRVTEWSPIGRRKRGRPRRSWRDEIDDDMERRNLEDGDWENREEWKLWLREGRQRQL